MRRFNNGSKGLTIAGAILFISVFATVLGVSCGNSSTLPVYTSSETVEKYTEPETTVKAESDIEFEQVTLFAEKVTVGIPKGWSGTTDISGNTYVHRETGSAIRLQELPYDPSINNITEQSAANTVVTNGKTFVGFQRTSSSSYELYYSDYKDSVYDYIEEVFWDRSGIYKFICICNDSDYDDMRSYFAGSFSTLVFNSSDSIPSDYVLLYDSGLEIEFGYPSGWYVSSTGSGTYYAQDDTGSVSCTLLPVEYQGTAESISVDDMSYLLSGNDKQGFVMESFSLSGDAIYVSSRYIRDNVRITEKTRAVISCGVMFIETVSYLEGTVDETFSQQCFSLFRSFRTEQVQEEAIPEEESDISESSENAEIVSENSEETQSYEILINEDGEALYD